MIEIITIGDEIMIGQIVDTNSAWISAQLNNAGFSVSRITSVHDDERQIYAALDTALAENKIVLITGGLGPTKDDITKKVLCYYFGTQLVFDESVYSNIKLLFGHRQSVLNELTRSQAMVPEDCTVIRNTVGTAPIMWFEHNEKVVVSMPGVPFEMKTVMEQEILPRLSERFTAQAIIHRTVQVYGYGESALALKIAGWEDALPHGIRLAYLPEFGIVKLRLSGTSDNRNTLNEAIEREIEKLAGILGDSLIALDGLPIEHTLANLLREKQLTLSTAESCTGGDIAHRITLIPGSSDYFKGSVVAYHNDLKKDLLGVSADDLNVYGAVSAQVVEQMASGIKKQTGSDWAVAVSGIAGPAGGTDEKPVGTVWIAAVSADGKITSKLFRFGTFPRETIIRRTTTAALIMVIEKLRETETTA